MSKYKYKIGDLVWYLDEVERIVALPRPDDNTYIVSCSKGWKILLNDLNRREANKSCIGTKGNFVKEPNIKLYIKPKKCKYCV